MNGFHNATCGCLAQKNYYLIQTIEDKMDKKEIINTLDNLLYYDTIPESEKEKIKVIITHFKKGDQQDD